MGVGSKIVKGYAKGAFYELGQEFEKKNHYWNIV
jgi:transglutaminase/protease-like cytokinesis protein 3